MDAAFGVAGIERRWRNVAARRATLVTGVLVAMLVSILFLTRFAMTLGHSELSLPLVVVLAGTALLAVTGSVRISPTRLGLFSLAVAGLLLSVMFGGGTAPSYMSFLNLILLYACWLFVVPDDGQFPAVIRILRGMLLTIAFSGILQFFAQAAIPGPMLFTWNAFFPYELLSHGFNYIIPAPGMGGMNKSNGFFLLEPSILSQMMTIALIVELEFFRPSWRMIVLAVALALSFSGTGLVLFVAVVPVMLITRGRGGILLVAVPAAMLLGAIMAGPRIMLMLDRLQEFDSDQSSGFARFLSPFFLFRDYLYPQLSTTLFGMGPGAIEGFMTKTAYLVHDPTWGKLIFEYGFLGAVPFVIYVGYCFFAGARSIWLASALFLNYLLLGGNLVDARLQVLILVLVVLQNRPSDVVVRPAVRIAGRGSRNRARTVPTA
jgi:hypothetical protein